MKINLTEIDNQSAGVLADWGEVAIDSFLKGGPIKGTFEVWLENCHSRRGDGVDISRAINFQPVTVSFFRNKICRFVGVIVTAGINRFKKA